MISAVHVCFVYGEHLNLRVTYNLREKVTVPVDSSFPSLP